VTIGRIRVGQTQLAQAHDHRVTLQSAASPSEMHPGSHRSPPPKSRASVSAGCKEPTSHGACSRFRGSARPQRSEEPHCYARGAEGVREGAGSTWPQRDIDGHMRRHREWPFPPVADLAAIRWSGLVQQNRVHLVQAAQLPSQRRWTQHHLHGECAVGRAGRTASGYRRRFPPPLRVFFTGCCASAISCPLRPSSLGVMLSSIHFWSHHSTGSTATPSR